MVTFEKKFAHGQVGKKTPGPVLGKFYIKALPHLAPTEIQQFSLPSKVSPTLFLRAHKSHKSDRQIQFDYGIAIINDDIVCQGRVIDRRLGAIWPR